MAAIVTGGAQGIGLEVARAFGREGAQVVIADIAPENAIAALGSLEADGLRVHAVACDVTSEVAVDELIREAVDTMGRLDIMVNNAGITRDGTLRKMNLEDFRQVIDVHLQGAWLGTRAAAEVMRKAGSGSIINMSSISGKVGNIGQTNYSAAKAGIVGLTKASAKELAHLGVRVNAIQPGLIKTPMTESMRPDIFEKKLAEIPMGRAGLPDEVAGAALFLASGLASYVTGVILEVTGGRYM